MADLPATTPQLQTLFADGQPAGAIVAADVRRLISTLDVRAPISVQAFGAKGDGSTNDSTAFQNALNAAEAAGGGIVYVPPTGFYYVIATGLKLPSGVTLMGAGSKNNDRPNAHTPSSIAQKGSWLLPTDTSNPAITMISTNGSTGSGAGARVDGLNFVYNQPPESGGTSWTPTTYPYTIKMNDHFQSIENIQIMGATHGISLDGSNVIGGTFGGTGCVISGVNAHVYNVGVHVDTCVDSFRLHDINIENLTGSVEHYNYMANHLIGFDMHRADNPWISDVQIFAALVGMLFTNSADGSARSMTNCCLNNLEFNLCASGFKVAASDTFVTAQVSSCLFQNSPKSFGNLTLADTSYLLDLRSNNAAFNFTGCNFTSDNTVLNLGAGSTSSVTGPLLGYPHCTFSSCEFSPNSNGGSTAWFIVAASAKVSTSSQMYRAVAGSKKTGSGTMVEASETTI